MKQKDHDICIFLLGIIGGISLSIIACKLVIHPTLIKESRKEAIEAKVAVYYTNSHDQIKFRFLTNDEDD